MVKFYDLGVNEDESLFVKAFSYDYKKNIIKSVVYDDVCINDFISFLKHSDITILNQFTKKSFETEMSIKEYKKFLEFGYYDFNSFHGLDEIIESFTDTIHFNLLAKELDY